MTPDTAPRVVEQNARTNRSIKRLITIFGVLFLLLNAITAGSVTWYVVEGTESSEAAEVQARQNADILRIILAVTGCTVDESPEVCAGRQAARSISEGTRRIIEVDCATRRALAGLPAADPKRACSVQTPPDVYPGTG